MSVGSVAKLMVAICNGVAALGGISVAVADNKTQYPFSCAGITPPEKTSAQYAFGPYNNCGKSLKITAHYCAVLERYEEMKLICPQTDHLYSLRPGQRIDEELAFFLETGTDINLRCKPLLQAGRGLTGSRLIR